MLAKLRGPEERPGLPTLVRRVWYGHFHSQRCSDPLSPAKAWQLQAGAGARAQAVLLGGCPQKLSSPFLPQTSSSPTRCTTRGPHPGLQQEQSYGLTSPFQSL